MENPVVKELLSLFTRQLVLQKQLQEEANRLQGFIMARELDKIGNVSFNIDQIVGQIELAEEERREIILTAKLGEQANVSFDQLLRTLPSNETAKLQKVRTELKEVVRDTSKMNHHNRILLEEALKSVSSSIKTITNRAKPSTGYDISGKTSSGNRRKLVNQIGQVGKNESLFCNERSHSGSICFSIRPGGNRAEYCEC